jgi:hypothetical protein
MIKCFRAGFAAFGLACTTLSPTVHAVIPTPDGGYPGENTAEGASALFHLNGGTYNTAVGWASLGFDLTGNLNTAVGAGALLFNTADQNTATGAGALLMNTIGTLNTANGVFALLNNTDGLGNTAIGANALTNNSTGVSNTGVGVNALSSNTADANTGVGAGALSYNTNGAGNTATGTTALYFNLTGNDNTATGFQALQFSSGNFNNAFGRNALLSVQNGDGNVAVGDSTLSNTKSCNNNTAIGNSALTNSVVGNYNIAIGFFAGANTNGDNNILIGNAGVANQANAIYIGNNTHAVTYIAGIYGDLVLSGGSPVYVGPDGQLGTNPSSRRFKKDVQPMDKTSDSILALNPVTFHYKNDPKATPCFGLVAEDVESVNPALVVRDKEGEPYTVRYEAVNAMLLNEFLKEHRKVQDLENKIAELTAGLRKVSDQLEQDKSHGHWSSIVGEGRKAKSPEVN